MTTLLSHQYASARLLAERDARRRAHRRDFWTAFGVLILQLLWLLGLGCGLGLAAVLLVARFLL